MQTLKEQYQNDKPLLHLYEKKLLIPGWAGQLDDAESVYVADALKSDRALFLLWRRAGHFKGMKKNVSPETAQKMALALAPRGCEDMEKSKIPKQRIMKQIAGGVNIPPPPPSNYETAIISDPSVLDSSITGPGRPRNTMNLSRTTLWRREKESQQLGMNL